MDTLNYILNKYRIAHQAKDDLIEIRNTGRDTLASVLHELDFKTGVEVGVQEGLYSEVIARENPQMKVYGVDPWLSYDTCKVDEARKKTENSSPQWKCEQFYENAKKRLSPYSNYEIIREFSVDAVNHFDDESLDFVYIDGNHKYEFVKDDITEWIKKIRKGGIISGHDYYIIKEPRALMHVKYAVDDYVKDNNIKPLIIWGIKARNPDEIRDRWRSWSWVKN